MSTAPRITQVCEIKEEELAAIEEKKKIIFAVQPHGVMSVAGICAGIAMVIFAKRTLFRRRLISA